MTGSNSRGGPAASRPASTNDAEPSITGASPASPRLAVYYALVVTEVVSLGAMTAGVAMLAHRAPAVARERAAATGAAAAHPQAVGSPAFSSAGRPEQRRAQEGAAE